MQQKGYHKLLVWQKAHIFVISDNQAGFEFWKKIGWQFRDDIEVMSKNLKNIEWCFDFLPLKTVCNPRHIDNHHIYSLQHYHGKQASTFVCQNQTAGSKVGWVEIFNKFEN